MILNERVLRNIIKNSISESTFKKLRRLNEAPVPPDVDIFGASSENSVEQERSQGIGMSAGRSTEVHITPKDNKMVFVNPLIGCYLKQQTIKRHQAIIKILATLAENVDVATAPKVLEMSGDVMGNEYNSARNSEIENALGITSQQMNVIIKNFEKIGYFDKNGFNLLKNLIENNFYVDIWKQMYSEITSLVNAQVSELKLSNILSFYCMFSYINSSTINPGADAQAAAAGDSANSFGSFSSKIDYYKNSKTVALLTKIADNSNIVKNLFLGENDNNPVFKTLLQQLNPDSGASEENKVIALQVYFYDKLMKYLEVNAGGKNINFSLVNELMEFIQKLVKGFFNLIIICQDIDTQIQNESDRLENIYASLLNSQRALNVTSQVLSQIFSKLDIVIIEGISKYIQKDFYKIEMNEQEKIKVKKANSQFMMAIRNKKQTDKGGTGKIPQCQVPAACCTKSVIQFNLNIGGNQTNTQKSGGI